MRYSDALPFASKHFGSTFALFADALEDADGTDADFEAAELPAEADFEAAELPAEAEDDVALEAEDALDAEEDAPDSKLDDGWLALIAAADAELCDCPKPEATSAIEELSPLVRP